MHTKQPESPKSLPFPTFSSSPKHLIMSQVIPNCSSPANHNMSYSPRQGLPQSERRSGLLLLMTPCNGSQGGPGLRPSWDSSWRGPEKLLPHTLDVLDLGSSCGCASVLLWDMEMGLWWGDGSHDGPGQSQAGCYATPPPLSVLFCGWADELLLYNLTISCFWCV